MHILSFPSDAVALRPEILRSRFELNARARWRLNLLQSHQPGEGRLHWIDRGWHRILRWTPLLMPLLIVNLAWFGMLATFLIYYPTIDLLFLQITGVLIGVDLIVLGPLWLHSRTGRRFELSQDRFRLFRLTWRRERKVSEGSVDDLQLVLCPFMVNEATRARLFFGLIVEHADWRFLLASREVDKKFELQEFRTWCLEALPPSLARRGLELAQRQLVINSFMG